MFDTRPAYAHFASNIQVNYQIPKNDSSSTALEAVSQPINGCAAQVEGQMLMSEG
jgi:hypothetical protein